MNPFISDNGDVFGWGNSEYAQLWPGMSNSSDQQEQQVARPVKLDLGSDVGKVIDVACGGTVCMVLNGEIKRRRIDNQSRSLFSSFYSREQRCFRLGLWDPGQGARPRPFQVREIDVF